MRFYRSNTGIRFVQHEKLSWLCVMYRRQMRMEGDAWIARSW